MKHRDKRLPEGWPQNEEELIEQMKDPGFLDYCEDRGIFIRFDDDNKHLTITKRDDLRRK